MPISQRLKRFGDHLRRVLATDESYGIVEHLVEGWDEGGCGIVAKAVKPILESRFGGPVNLVAVIGTVTTESGKMVIPYMDMVGHVLAAVGDVLFDSRGAHTTEAVIAQAKKDGFVRPRLVPFESMRLPDEDPEYQAGVFCPADLIRAMTKFLKLSL